MRAAPWFRAAVRARCAGRLVRAPQVCARVRCACRLPGRLRPLSRAGLAAATACHRPHAPARAPQTAVREPACCVAVLLLLLGAALRQWNVRTRAYAACFRQHVCCEKPPKQVARPALCLSAQLHLRACVMIEQDLQRSHLPPDKPQRPSMMRFATPRRYGQH